MSNLEAVIKVTDQLIYRVLDQRQFSTGEINYFVREIGGDQIDLDGNFNKLLKTNENVCIIADKTNVDSCGSYDPKAKDLCTGLEALLKRTERILQLEHKFKSNNENCLSEKRKQLEQAKQQTLDKCRSKLENVREASVQEELELERKYLKFEENSRNK